MKKVLLTKYFLVVLIYLTNSTYTLAVAQKNNINNEDYKNDVLRKTANLLETKYVLPELAKKHANEFRKKHESGAYKNFSNPGDFATQVTSDLINLTKDKHFSFRLKVSSKIGEKTESALRHPIRYFHPGIKENKGFSKLEWIDGNIGYLDLRRFYYHSDVKDMVNASFTLLTNASAIIIDLRKNGGGSGDYLSSYFLDHPTQLTCWYSREDDFTTEFWTSSNIEMEPLVDIPLFLLTSRETFSSAESFAYDMKVRKRATIVGDSTKGGAHSVDLFQIDDQFEIYIPTTRAINPVTGKNWEGIGVVPDIIVPSESALDTAIVLAQKAGTEFAKSRGKKLKLAIKEMQTHPDHAEILFRENKKIRAGTALDSVFQIAGKYNLTNEFFIDVLAYNYSSQDDEQILYAILKKKIELFPHSPAAYETLAYAYFKNKKTQLAISNFEKVIELDPENRNAIKMINKIRGE